MPKKKKPQAKRKRNSPPSLVGTLASSYFPIGDMEGLAKGARADLKRVKKAVNAKKSAPVKRKRRRNPAEQDAAAALYEDFHQKGADSVTTYVEEELHRSDLAELGDMVSLVVATLSGYRATIAFEENDAPKLCSSADRRQLYIKGGDQTLDLGALHMSGPEWMRDDMLIGVITKLTYRTEKGFDDFQLTDYWHRLGEETGLQPFLRYDTLNRRLYISGGQYAVKHEGIVN